nr:hypothetical protein HK105_006777 [Polyrhizophydium stewartii]
MGKGDKDKDDKDRKLPWGINKPKPGSAKTLTKAKIAAFSVGVQKKSALEKQREADEARRKREEEEAARVLEEFTASFEQTSSVRRWVKATVSAPDHDPGAEPAEQPKPGSAKAPAAAAASAPKPAAPKPPPPVFESRAQKRRNMDAFLEELKQQNADASKRNRSAAGSTASGGGGSTSGRGNSSGGAAAGSSSRPGLASLADSILSSASAQLDDAYSTTTNLFVGNMKMSVVEDDLNQMFGMFGPLASVKVMVPRNEEEMRRDRKWGFVCFMRREDAEDALAALAGRELFGVPMHLDWGKGMTLPEEPVFGEIHVAVPSDKQQLVIIHSTIESVLVHGPHFEQHRIRAESGNPDFAFLVNYKSREHQYYRWKLYSLTQGDQIDRWCEEPFSMVKDGPLWIPPPQPFSDQPGASDDDGAASDDGSDTLDGGDPEDVELRRGPLTVAERKRFARMLRRMTTDRLQIAKAMVFCIERVDATEEIQNILLRSLLAPTTPLVPTKMGRLFLLSDVLCNTVVSPNGWRLRAGVQKHLDEVFAHFGLQWRAVESRLKAEQIRKAVMAVVAAWEAYHVLTGSAAEELRAAFASGDRTGVASGGRGAGSVDGDGDGTGSGAADPTAAKFVRAPMTGFVPIEAEPTRRVLDELRRNAQAGAAQATTEESIEAAAPPASAPADAGRDEDLDGEPLAAPVRSPGAAPAAQGAAPAAAAAATSVAAVGTAAAPAAVDGDGDDDEDLDGVPLQLPPKPAPAAPAAASNNDGDAEEDEDIDGVPLQLPPRQVLSAAPMAVVADDDDDDDEDLDGVPLTK